MKLHLNLIRDKNGSYLTPSQLKDDLIVISDEVVKVEKLPKNIETLNNDIAEIKQKTNDLINSSNDLLSLNRSIAEINEKIDNLDSYTKEMIKNNFLELKKQKEKLLSIISDNSAILDKSLEDSKNSFFQVNITMSNIRTTQEGLEYNIVKLKKLWFIRLSFWFTKMFRYIKGDLK